MSPRLVVAVLVAAAAVPGAAQAQAADLIDRVPDGYALCVTMRDLRDHWERWQGQAWFRKVAEGPVGRAFLDAPEIRHLRNIENDLRQAFGLNWSNVRDDLFGDQVVFAFKPGPAGNSELDEGLILVRARKAEQWPRIFEKLNELQKENGELKELTERKFDGQTYWKRTLRQDHWIAIDGPVLAVANKESALLGALGRRDGKEATSLARSLRKAGHDRAFLSIWLNPRLFDKELEKAPEQTRSNPVFKTLLATWKGIDAAVVTADWREQGEIRMYVQPSEKLPAEAKAWFERKPRASEAWSRLSDGAVFAFAGKFDFADGAKTFSEMASEKDAKEAKDSLQRQFGSLLGLDVFKEIVPNIGPDLGLALYPASDPRQIPHALFALRVKPGKGDVAVDQALVKSLQLVVGFGLFDWNRKLPEPIRLKTLKQGSVEVHYLAHDKLFPAGFQPAFGLKDGYLIAATAPEAFLRFAETKGSEGDEAPILRLSASALVEVLKNHRDTAAVAIAERNNIPLAEARERLEALIATLAPFDRWTLSQGLQQGQMVWSLRIVPAK